MQGEDKVCLVVAIAVADVKVVDVEAAVVAVIWNSKLKQMSSQRAIVNLSDEGGDNGVDGSVMMHKPKAHVQAYYFYNNC